MDFANQIIILPHPTIITIVHNLLHFDCLLGMLQSLVVKLVIVHVVLCQGVVHFDKKRMLLSQPFFTRVQDKIDRLVDHIRPVFYEPFYLGQVAFIGKFTRKANLVKR